MTITKLIEKKHKKFKLSRKKLFFQRKISCKNVSKPMTHTVLQNKNSMEQEE
jgi:hypothetical protein